MTLEEKPENKKVTVHTMYCLRPKEIERCNGTNCPYEHIWTEEIKNDA